MMLIVKTLKIFLISIFCILAFSCVSDEKSEEITEENVPVAEQIIVEQPVVELPTIEEPEEIPVEIEQEPLSQEDLEYSRSVTDLGVEVSKETFTEDKAEILEIIQKLDLIMKHKDYAAWLNYLTPESKTFWSNQQNLALVSQRLPIKNYRLKNLQDYFEKVFIPSRIGRVVDEIRYVSTTKVKAVQYTEQQDIIYYYFEKIDGRWFLHLDTTT